MWYSPVFSSCVRPFLCLTTRLAHDPMTQRYDQAVPLCLGYKAPGSQGAMRRMTPAHQRFQAHDTAGLELDLGLVHKEQLLRRDRLAQLSTYDNPCTDLGFHQNRWSILARPRAPAPSKGR